MLQMLICFVFFFFFLLWCVFLCLFDNTPTSVLNVKEQLSLRIFEPRTAANRITLLIPYTFLPAYNNLFQARWPGPTSQLSGLPV